MEREVSLSFHLSVFTFALLVVLSVLCLPRSCNTQREEATVAGQPLLVVNRSAHGDFISLLCGGVGELMAEEPVRECAAGSSIFVSTDWENASCTRDSILQQECSFQLATTMFDDNGAFTMDSNNNSNIAATVKSNRIRVFYNSSYQVGRLRNASNCTVMNVGVVSNREVVMATTSTDWLVIDPESGEMKAYINESYHGKIYKVTINCDELHEGCLYLKLTGTSTIPLSEPCDHVTELEMSSGSNRDDGRPWWVVYLGGGVMAGFFVLWLGIAIAMAKGRQGQDSCCCCCCCKRRKKGEMQISKPITSQCSHQASSSMRSGRDVSISVHNPNYECTI